MRESSHSSALPPCPAPTDAASPTPVARGAPLPCPAADECWLFLLRHGATANNLAHPPRLQGSRSDMELSPAGLAQAEAAAQFLAAWPVAAVYASPLLRARETAAALARRIGQDVVAVPELRECDVGSWEGRSWEEIRVSEPQAYADFVRDPFAHPYRGGENFQDVVARTVPALDAIARRHPGEIVAVVAHNVVNRCILAPLLGVPWPQAREIAQHNCGVNVLSFRGGRGRVLTLNAGFHLSQW